MQKMYVKVVKAKNSVETHRVKDSSELFLLDYYVQDDGPIIELDTTTCTDILIGTVFCGSCWDDNGDASFEHCFYNQQIHAKSNAQGQVFLPYLTAYDVYC